MEEQHIPEQPMLPPALPTGPQKRIAALSVQGDIIHRISIPALKWMVENGDEALQRQAAATIAFWEREQGWFIEWGNQTRFFELTELAIRDLAKFKQAMKTIPADNEGTQRIIELALLSAKDFLRPRGIGRKNILRWAKKQRRGKKR